MNLTFMNELNERNAEVASFKKRQDVLEATLKAKEKVYEQDIEVRMKLGRRLEQIFLDKEEIAEELYEVKEHAQRLEEELAKYKGAEIGANTAALLDLKSTLLLTSGTTVTTSFYRQR